MVAVEVVRTSRRIKKAELNHFAARLGPVSYVCGIIYSRSCFRAHEAVHVGFQFREVCVIHLEQAETADAAIMIIRIADSRKQRVHVFPQPEFGKRTPRQPSEDA